MSTFSERYGYIKPSSVIIRERMTDDIQNAICSCFDRLGESLEYFSYDRMYFTRLKKSVWVYFFNQRENLFSPGNRVNNVITDFIVSDEDWNRKLDLIEFSIKILYRFESYPNYIKLIDEFVSQLNWEFKRLNFAYRIVKQEVVEVTSEEEIIAIEDAISNSSNNIKLHLNKALELYSKRPAGDYANSIKESISAVEAFCREKTGENTLGKALNQLESSGIIIPKMIKSAFVNFYAYTNSPESGIRHALMDVDGTYTPSKEEALFLLVSCSSFINYLNSKCK